MGRRKVEELFWQVGGDLPRLSEEFGGTRPRLAPAKAWEPRVDLVEDPHRFVLKVEIAGVRAEDISLLYLPTRHALLLRGVRPDMVHPDSERALAHQLEILVGEFEREVRFPPVPVDGGKIRAQYRNGILTVVVPKLESAS